MSIRICSGCDKVIKDGTPHQVYAVASGGATGGGDVYYHSGCGIPRGPASLPANQRTADRA